MYFQINNVFGIIFLIFLEKGWYQEDYSKNKDIYLYIYINYNLAFK